MKKNGFGCSFSLIAASKEIKSEENKECKKPKE